MEMRMISKITGITSNKGNLPDGKLFDVTNIFVEMKLKGANAMGYASKKYRFGDSSKSKIFAGMTFPMPAEIIMEPTVNGAGEDDWVVLDVRPVDTTTGELKGKK